MIGGTAGFSSTNYKSAIMSLSFNSYIVLVASLITFLGCKFQNDSDSTAYEFQINSDSITYETFQSEKYSMLYPKEWKIDSSENFGVLLLKILDPRESSEDQFTESILLTTINLPDSIADIDKFIKWNKEDISKLGDSIVIKRKKDKDSTSFCQIESENSRSGSLSKYVQALWLGKQKVYMLTCTSEKKNLKIYYDIFQKVINSFRLNR